MISHDRHIGDEFNEEYFERGITTGRSIYENYRWMPERSLVEAHWFVTHMHCHQAAPIMDFGCAKGFFVRALRLLGYRAYGVDISEYAISRAPNDVREFIECQGRPSRYCEFGLCKDVLEHCDGYDHLNTTVVAMAASVRRWLIIVPLGDGTDYVIPDYENDDTHRIRYTAEEWLTAIERMFTVDQATYHLHGFKMNWAHYPQGNLFVMATVK